MNDEMVWLRVPKDIADRLNDIAKEDGITARGKWAVKARMILKQAVEELGVGKE